MKCNTLLGYDKNLHPIYKPKLNFDTLDAAIAYAKKLNAKDHVIHKLVAYKCNLCFKYHIGRNGKEITEKQRNKYRQ